MDSATRDGAYWRHGSVSPERPTPSPFPRTALPRLTAPCIYCGARVSAPDGSSHETVCESRPVECNMCGKEIRAALMEEHRSVCGTFRCALCRLELPHATLTEFNRARKAHALRCPALAQGDAAGKTACEYCAETVFAVELAEHLEACPERPVPCPHRGCLRTVALANVAAHAAECRYRPTRCDLCGEEMQAMRLLSHELKCLERPVPCPTCPALLKRGRAAEHQCPALLVDEDEERRRANKAAADAAAARLQASIEADLNRPAKRYALSPGGSGAAAGRSSTHDAEDDSDQEFTDEELARARAARTKAMRKTIASLDEAERLEKQREKERHERERDMERMQEQDRERERAERIAKMQKNLERLQRESQADGPTTAPTATEDEEQAATRIQAVFKGRKARIEADLARQEREEQTAAATKIQARFRGLRERAHNDEARRKLSEEENRAQHEAAVRIQGAARVRRAKLEAEERRRERAARQAEAKAEAEAATRIQAQFRGHRVRAHMAGREAVRDREEGEGNENGNEYDATQDRFEESREEAERAVCIHCMADFEDEAARLVHDGLCPKKLVMCVHDACDAVMPRSDLDAHVQQCEWRAIPCPHQGCPSEPPAIRLEEHVRYCEHAPAPSPPTREVAAPEPSEEPLSNGRCVVCGTRVAAEGLALHREIRCPAILRARAIMAKLTPSLGLKIKKLDAGAGVRVHSVAPGGPAELAGILDGDSVVSIDGAPVTTAQAFVDACKPIRAGGTAVFGVVRGPGGQPEPINVMFGAKNWEGLDLLTVIAIVAAGKANEEDYELFAEFEQQPYPG